MLRRLGNNPLALEPEHVQSYKGSVVDFLAKDAKVRIMIEARLQ